VDGPFLRFPEGGAIEVSGPVEIVLAILDRLSPVEALRVWVSRHDNKVVRYGDVEIRGYSAVDAEKLMEAHSALVIDTEAKTAARMLERERRRQDGKLPPAEASKEIEPEPPEQ